MISDLAADFCRQTEAEKGIKVTETHHGEITERQVEILTDTAAKSVGKERGTYLSLEVPYGAFPEIPLTLRLKAALKTLVLPVVPQRGRVLIVGLGNGNLSCDALGSLAVSRLVTGQGSRAEVLTLSPGVEGVTGLSGAAVTEAVVRSVCPDAVLCIDALVTADFARVGSVFQLTDTGISPGSGTGVRVYAISRKSLGVPVFSMGVPLAVPYGEEGEKRYVVCPREIDLTVRKAARVLGDALNLAFHPELTLRDLYAHFC